MPPATSPASSRHQFQQAINNALHLHYKSGLAAIPASEGRSRVSAQNTRRILGSADIDKDCNPHFPSDSRWDFVVGYQRTSGPFAHFIEVHPATTSEVSRLEAKLKWLREYLQQKTNQALADLPRQFHWVASDKVKIPKNTRQYRRLAKSKRDGIPMPTEHLQLT